jgi:polar amino acid transport system substrate-binding protein
MRFLRFALLSCMLISAIPVWADGGGVSGTFAPFRLVTSDLPPFANENQRDKPGFAVEITQAIAAKLGQQVKAEYYPWARAYALSQAEPRVVIIPLTRTPDRQAHFQWLVKIFLQQYVFVSKASDKLITSLDAARAINRIGVLRGSPTTEFALREHFSSQHLYEEASVEAGLKDLDSGRIDVYFGGSAIFAATINATGRKLADYQFGVSLGGGEIWLGASRGFSDMDIAAMRQAFDALTADGTYARLLKKYNIEN